MTCHYLVSFFGSFSVKIMTSPAIKRTRTELNTMKKGKCKASESKDAENKPIFATSSERGGVTAGSSWCQHCAAGCAFSLAAIGSRCIGGNWAWIFWSTRLSKRIYCQRNIGSKTSMFCCLYIHWLYHSRNNYWYLNQDHWASAGNNPKELFIPPKKMSYHLWLCLYVHIDQNNSSSLLCPHCSCTTFSVSLV